MGLVAYACDFGIGETEERGLEAQGDTNIHKQPAKKFPNDRYPFLEE
jgi:hypothetical protein